jgi:hypothetical protein
MGETRGGTPPTTRHAPSIIQHTAHGTRHPSYNTQHAMPRYNTSRRYTGANTTCLSSLSLSVYDASVSVISFSLPRLPSSGGPWRHTRRHGHRRGRPNADYGGARLPPCVVPFPHLPCRRSVERCGFEGCESNRLLPLPRTVLGRPAPFSAAPLSAHFCLDLSVTRILVRTRTSTVI